MGLLDTSWDFVLYLWIIWAARDGRVVITVSLIFGWRKSMCFNKNVLEEKGSEVFYSNNHQR
jgi:hypothetical protein